MSFFVSPLQTSWYCNPWQKLGSSKAVVDSSHVAANMTINLAQNLMHMMLLEQQHQQHGRCQARASSTVGLQMRTILAQTSPWKPCSSQPGAAPLRLDSALHRLLAQLLGYLSCPPRPAPTQRPPPQTTTMGMPKSGRHSQPRSVTTMSSAQAGAAFPSSRTSQAAEAPSVFTSSQVINR